MSVLWWLFLLVVAGLIYYLFFRRGERTDKFSDPMSSTQTGHRSSRFENDSLNRKAVSQKNTTYHQLRQSRSGKNKRKLKR